MDISESHASHIRWVSVAFIISGADFNPDTMTVILDRKPDKCARKGDPRKNYAGKSLSPEQEGWWRIESTTHVKSKDVNDHFEFLLGILLPHRQKILELAKNGETYFDVLWKSTYLYAGTGPLLSASVCEGIGMLKAGVGFDIYQIEEKD